MRVCLNVQKHSTTSLRVFALVEDLWPHTGGWSRLLAPRAAVSPWQRICSHKAPLPHLDTPELSRIIWDCSWLKQDRTCGVVLLSVLIEQDMKTR